MFKIEDGRSQFYQWDLDRKLIVEDPTITEVHFCNRTDNCSLVCETYQENGITLVNVPNLLLQTDWKIHVYAYVGYTKHDECFEVKSRTKPADYIYTETEIKRYEDFENRIKDLELNVVSLAVKDMEIKSDITGLKSKDAELYSNIVNVAEESHVGVNEERSNSHRKISIQQRGITIGDFDCAGKQNGTNGQSWYLTDYTNSYISGDYSASLGFDNDSIGNGNIIGGIKNDITGRGCLSIGEKNLVSNSLGTGSIVGGTNNSILSTGVGSIIGGNYNSIESCATGAIIGGHHADVNSSEIVFALGNGTSSSAPSNLYEICTTGAIKRKGIITITRDINGNLKYVKDNVVIAGNTVAPILLSNDRLNYEWRIKADSKDDNGTTYTNTTIVKDFVDVVKADGTKEIRLVAHDNIRIFMIFFHFSSKNAYTSTTSTADKIKDIALGSLGDIF